VRGEMVSWSSDVLLSRFLIVAPGVHAVARGCRCSAFPSIFEANSLYTGIAGNRLGAGQINGVFRATVSIAAHPP